MTPQRITVSALAVTKLKKGAIDMLRGAARYARQQAGRLTSKSRKYEADRTTALSMLNRISRQTLGNRSHLPENTLVDGMWDNPNYWFRYSQVRRALGLAEGKERGLLGRYSRGKVKRSFSLLGITDLVDYSGIAKTRPAHIKQALTLLGNVELPEDLLRISLPDGFPPALVFDGILKRQRRSTVDIHDPELPEYLAEAIAHVEAANNIVGEGAFDLVVLSHALDYTYAALAWAAIKRNIPVLVLYGDYGVARFFHLMRSEDLFAYPGRPTEIEMESMPPEIQARLHAQGVNLLRARLTGKTSDVGAVYSYQRRQTSVNREKLAQQFGWDPLKPVIGVYNSNWFDYPHGCGLNYFRDFLEWIQQTLDVAKSHDSVNWLFKSHPCDDWYASIRGARLEDLIEATNQPHIRLADKSWNGLNLIQTLDGIVTCHGTIGIEAPALGTPALVAYSGWYGHAGFVVNPESRDGYLAALKTEWWKKQDKMVARQRAELFAGWMFCSPEWHGTYVMQDDSLQDSIYHGLPDFIADNATAMTREVQEIRDWYDEGHRYLHVYKMTRAKSFQTGIAAQMLVS